MLSSIGTPPHPHPYLTKKEERNYYVKIGITHTHYLSLVLLVYIVSSTTSLSFYLLKSSLNIGKKM
jgi:hypothetical protein